jgi:glutamate/tyrosine decarboxylase-like PLP-dependent enzyme
MCNLYRFLTLEVPVKELLKDAADRSIHYLDTLDARSVAPDPASVPALCGFDGPMPEVPSEPRQVLRMLDELGSPATMAMAGRRFFGFVIGGSLPVTLAARWLADAWDQNSAYYRTTPATAHLEQVSLGWLVDLLGLPPGTGGSFVTGATVANFTALAAARHAVLSSAGWDIEGQGLYGAPEISVVLGAEAHASVFKALGMIGLGRNRVIKVPADAQGRMRADALPDLKEPAIVIVQAGNVNTGAFDPFEQIIPWAHQKGAWVHVDGAFGLWAKAAPSLSHLAAGAEQADSWATDAHKYLNVPYDCGLALVREPDALGAAMAISAEYLPVETEGRDPAHYTPELSRRARGVEVWAALQALGRQGVIDLVERTCAYARRFAEGFATAGHQVLNNVVLNQVLVSFGTPEATNRVIQAIQQDGACWCGGTVWQGQTAMRISVSSWATTGEDVERSLEVMLRIAKQQAS